MKRHKAFYVYSFLAVLLALSIYALYYFISRENFTEDKERNREIRTIAYESLTQDYKDMVVDWEKASVYEQKAEEYYAIPLGDITPLSTLKPVEYDETNSIQGRDVYSVSFDIDSPTYRAVCVYIDSNTEEILGQRMYRHRTYIVVE